MELRHATHMQTPLRTGELKTVFFDVGSTLLRPEPSVSEVCREVFAQAGYFCDRAAIDAAMPLVEAYYEDRYREDDTFWADEEATLEVWVAMYSLLCHRVGIYEQAEPLARRIYDEFGSRERWALYDDVLPAFERLRSRGISIGIISNWDTRLEGLLADLGVTEYTGDVISSAAVGLRKPDPRIFALACSRYGVRAERAAHVGDHGYADFYGARAAGIYAVLLDRTDSAGETQPRINSLDALEDALGI